MAVVEDAGISSPVSTNQNDPRGQNDSDHQVVRQQQQKIGSVELQDQSGNGNEKSTQKMGLARNMDQVNGNSAKALEKEMRDLEDMLSKLNPMAKEFVPPSFSVANSNYILVPVVPPNGMHFGYNAANNFIVHAVPGVANANLNTKKKNGLGQGKQRMNNRTSMAQQEEVIRRTVYVSDIDQEVTEESLAALFLTCGQVVDCRICGDPKSILRFAFVEFTDEEGASNALSLSGFVLGYYPLKVMPSKTAIAPVNPTFLPRSEDEREMCARTVYCTNIDKKVTQANVRIFFETFCGEVHRLRLLGDYNHSTRIAFVEFVMAESAIVALSFSGAILGSLPIRVSPSKTPVRPRTAPRSPMH
ncbi:RNA splicing factor [Lithospermum erythrorhizon]|uniref:RNA splicing factor n=1 Tax=Lithospermum erythrorhizon TaxID=34254 RepID=A0AAV3PW22_LITER